MSIISIFAGHVSVNAHEDFRLFINASPQTDTNGETLIKNQIQPNTSTTYRGAYIGMGNVEAGVPLTSKETWVKMDYRSMDRATSHAPRFGLRATDGTEILVVNTLDYSFGAAQTDLNFFGTRMYVLHQGSIGRIPIDARITVDSGTLVGTVRLYIGLVHIGDYTKQLTADQAAKVPYQLFYRNILNDRSEDNRIYQMMATQGEPTTNKKLKVISLDGDGTFSDFNGTVTDINETVSTPSLNTVDTTVPDAKSTFTTEAISQVAKESYKVTSIIPAALATAGAGTLNNLEFICTDGVTVHTLGVQRQISSEIGTESIMTNETINPFTGTAFTMEDLDILEFGFRAKSEV
ncbi:hypothetical protein HOU79_gp72 [Vibrio phage 1.224.A._10N.261.48.B1]|uniref:Uncharacterized protein n=1 Tax=Vibrio phage 1.224.A._10N.261.48.B1 TaxID=1881226 RepID=A0A2I7RRW8_9CAUD|nr:hypothetical protein HOU79_gp72 [Vibrio phage 1.224.A._10N.261.48.B1]AUR96401.1 hypothetical protein NVP1224A_34 [Vibrio phage 1.224.A._10N.261.48.B1]